MAHPVCLCVDILKIITKNDNKLPSNFSDISGSNCGLFLTDFALHEMSLRTAVTCHTVYGNPYISDVKTVKHYTFDGTDNYLEPRHRLFQLAA